MSYLFAGACASPHVVVSQCIIGLLLDVARPCCCFHHFALKHILIFTTCYALGLKDAARCSLQWSSLLNSQRHKGAMGILPRRNESIEETLQPSCWHESSSEMEVLAAYLPIRFVLGVVALSHQILCKLRRFSLHNGASAVAILGSRVFACSRVFEGRRAFRKQHRRRLSARTGCSACLGFSRVLASSPTSILFALRLVGNGLHGYHLLVFPYFLREGSTILLLCPSIIWIIATIFRVVNVLICLCSVKLAFDGCGCQFLRSKCIFYGHSVSSFSWLPEATVGGLQGWLN